MYFALVIFKTAESASLLHESKFLQTKVNSLARKAIGFMTNPFLAGEKLLIEDEDEGSDAEQMRENKIQKHKMEEGGFTLITQSDLNPKRTKGRDSYDNVVTGITEEEAKEVLQKQMMTKRRARLNSGDSLDSNKLEYVTTKAKKDGIKKDFYMFQKKLIMKSELEKLREGFEADRKRLSKALSKEKSKTAKHNHKMAI